MNEQTLKVYEDIKKSVKLRDALVPVDSIKRESTLNVMMTPEWAATLMSGNTGNRPLSKKRVQRYVRAIDHEEWRANGCTMSFAPDGQLLNGQHRLAAIILSGKSAPIDIFWNEDPAVVPTMDIGGNRTAGDNIARLGAGKGSSDLAACISWLWRLINARVWPTAERPSNARSVTMYEDIPELRDICANLIIATPRKMLPRGQQAALTYMFNQTRPGDVKEFWTKVLLGEGLESKGPNGALYMLRNSLVNNPKNRVEHKLALVIKAWNYWHAGYCPKQLAFGMVGVQEAFPVVEGWDPPKPPPSNTSADDDQTNLEALLTSSLGKD